GSGVPWGRIESGPIPACDGQVPGEPRFALARAGDKGKGHRTDGVGCFVETRDGKLEHPFAAEPCRSRADLAMDRVRQVRGRGPKRVDERWNEVVAHITEEPEGDVPLSGRDRPEVLYRPRFQ